VHGGGPEVVSRKCGGIWFYRHRQWSGRVECGGDVPQQAPAHPGAHPDHRPCAALCQAPAQARTQRPFSGSPSVAVALDGGGGGLSKDFLCGREAKLDLHSPGWFVRQNVELLRGITVEHIDIHNQEVVTAGGRRYGYWHLVLACGAKPVPLRVPGGESALSLRSFADAPSS
jgi:hypothetical protein